MATVTETTKETKVFNQNPLPAGVMPVSLKKALSFPEWRPTEKGEKIEGWLIGAYEQKGAVTRFYLVLTGKRKGYRITQSGLIGILDYCYAMTYMRGLACRVEIYHTGEGEGRFRWSVQFSGFSTTGEFVRGVGAVARVFEEWKLGWCDTFIAGWLDGVVQFTSGGGKYYIITFESDEILKQPRCYCLPGRHLDLGTELGDQLDKCLAEAKALGKRCCVTILHRSIQGENRCEIKVLPSYL